MPWIVPAVAASLVNSLVLVLVYIYLAWIERDQALRIFSLGWLIYSLRFAGMLGYVHSGNTSTFWLAVDETAAIGSSVILLMAVMRLLQRRLPRWSWYAVGIGLAWVALMSYFRPALWLYSLPAYFICGTNFILLGLAFIRTTKLPILEARFVGITFILLGIHKLDYPWLRPVEWFAPWGYTLGAVLGLFGALGIILVYLKRAREQISQSQTNYHNLVEASPFPIFVHRDSVLAYANTSAAKLLGLVSAQELIGQPLARFMPESEYQRIQSDEGYVASRNERELTLELLRSDGQPVIIHGISLDVQFEGNPARLSFCHDITEQQQLELRLRQAERLQALGTLAGGIAHDFNNILFAIQGFTELARGEAAPASQIRDYLDEVLLACQRAADLIKQILSFARRQNHQPQPFKLAPVVKEALRLLRASLPSTVTFNVQLDQQALDVAITADPTGIHQVIMNLCTNASHAMPEGGELSVRMLLKDITEEDIYALPGLKPGWHVLLSVADTGTGIAETALEHIFEPFFTTKAPGEGTGMGLAVVHGIVTAYGGTIAVQTELGSGSEFTVYLPAVCEGSNGEGELSATDVMPRGCGQIALVDDEPVLLDLLEQMVRGLGYEPVRCEDGRAALQAIRAEPDSFCAVVTDQTMPHLTGLELARQLAVAAPRLPVILLTGFSTILTAESLRGTMVKDVLHKPVLQQDLATVLARVCPSRETAPVQA